VTFTWNNMAKGVGSKISWKVYVRDLSGNEAASGVKSFDIVSDVTPPSADYVGQWADQIAPGATNDLYAKWSDNAALARAELWVGESNVTSRKANEMLLSGRSMWSNFTYRPSGGDGTSVSWSVKAYDYSGIMAETALQSFTVLGDKIPPIISGLAQSSDWTEVGNTITLSADVTDNMALENAKLVIDDVVVQTTDLGGAKSAKASFDYMPPAIGTVRWNIIVQDTAGNSVKSDARTFTVSMKCAGTQPAPSQYGTCTNGEKKRVVYACDEKTGTWKATVETAACEEQFKELPIAYMLVGTVLVAIAVSSLLLYRKKYFRAAKPGKAEPGAVQW
jgi:hypothetical protein